MQSDLDEDFDAWVMLNRERLYKRAYVICGSWHQADDLVQEALIKVYPKWLAVTNKGDPMPYVRRVLVRACIDQGRRPWRREDPVGQLPEQVDPVVADVDFEPLLAALRRMPARQRAVLVLRYWDQLTVKETAAAIGTSEGNVKAQSSRGVHALRAALATIPELNQ